MLRAQCGQLQLARRPVKLLGQLQPPLACHRADWIFHTNAELFDPISLTWANTGPLHIGRDRHSARLLPNGKVLVTGGLLDAAGDTTSSVELYDPASEAWSSDATLNAARNNFASTLLTNGNVLAAGGQGPSGFLSSTEVYTSSNITVTAARLVPAASLSAGTFQCEFTNTPDVSFIAYYATNPSTPLTNWKVISGPTEVSPGHYQLSDPQAGSNSRGFYRIRSP
jgi:hypothetical protein